MKPYLSLVFCLVCAAATSSWGQNVRYYEQNGVTYRETTAKVRRPVREIEQKEYQQTVYRDKYDTRFQSVQQYNYQPVTQYRWQPKYHGWWNVLQGPHLAYHLEQRTVWQPRLQNYQVPVTTRTVVPETRTVRVGVPKLAMKEDDVVTRVAVGPAAATTTASQTLRTGPSLAWNVAPQVPNYGYAAAQPVYVPAYGSYPAASSYAYPAPNWGYGGVARLTGDPPRGGYAGEGAWQARAASSQLR